MPRTWRRFWNMDETKHPRTPHAGQGGHETTDVNVWAIGKFAIGLVVVCVVSLVLLFGLLKFFQSREETSVANTVEPTKLFPEPQLQKTELLDLKALHAEEDKLLNGRSEEHTSELQSRQSRMPSSA